MFDPRAYDYDPTIEAAHRETLAATEPASLDFSEGFTGGLESFGAWATSGLSGQLLSLLATEDKQIDWFVQRHGVEVAGADINQLQRQIDALKAEAEVRDLTPQEVEYGRELAKLRKDIVEGLTYAKKHADGDLDAEIYKNGESFNDRYGVSPEEKAGLGMFFKVLKENPSYTAGAIVGELFKDLPLTAATIFGLSKADNLGKAVRLVNRRLAAIKSKTGRTIATLGTGIGVGAAAGAGYEGAYSALDQGEIKSDDVWMGAKFGGTFGVLGGLGLMYKAGKRADVIGKAKVEGALVGSVADATKSDVGKAAENAAKNGDTVLKVANDLDTDQDRITQQAKEMTVLSGYHQQVRTMPKNDNAIVRTSLADDSDDIITYLNEAKLEERRIALLKEIEERLKRGEDVEQITFRNLDTLKNSEAYKALVLAQQKAEGKFLLDARQGRPLTEDWRADALELTQRELDLYDNQYAAETAAKRREFEKQQELEEMETPEGQEATIIADKIRQRKADIKEYERISRKAEKDRTPEEVDRFKELDTKLRDIEEAESLELPPMGRFGQWAAAKPKQAMAVGALAGATLLPGETTDRVYGAIAGAGIGFAGPKAYKAITRAHFNQAAWKARADISKGIEANANEMKILEMFMQYTLEEVKDVFPDHADGLRLISYLETGKNKNKDGTPILTTKDEVELADNVRLLLDNIGKEAVDAGIIDNASDMRTGKFKKGEKGAFLHNYFPHLFNTKMTDEALAELVEIWGRASTKSGLERMMLGSIEMIMEQHPDKAKNLITDPGRALELYTQAMTKAIHGKRMLNSLEELDLSMGKGTYMPALMTDKAFRILKRNEDMTEQELLHYETLDHSSLKGYRVHTDMKPLVDDHFDVLRKGTLSEAAQSVLDLNNGLKRIFVFGSMFHGQALVTSLAYALGVNGLYHGLRGTHNKALTDGTMWHHMELGSGEFKERAAHAIRFGLQIINIKKQELVSPGREKVKNLLEKWGKAGEIPNKVFDGIDHITWSYFHDRFKLATFLRKEEIVYKNLKKKGFKEEDARRIAGEEAADFANDAFGSLNWDRFTTQLYEYAAKNPTKLRGRIAGAAAQVLPVKKRKWLNLGLFAPDWTISNLRIVGRMFSLGYKYTDHQIKAIHRGQGWNTKEGQALLEAWKMYAAYSARAGVVNSALWYMVTEMFSEKEPTMDALADFWFGEQSHKLDLGGGHSVVISKQIAEPIHWVQHPMHTLSNKMSVVPKTGMELFMNKQWFSLKKDIPTGPALIDADGNYHHAKWLLGKVTPIVVKPMFQDDLTVGERLNRVLTGFGGFPQYTVKQ